MSVQATHHVGSQPEPNARDLAAVASTLSWADDAAARGDYAVALPWIETLDAIGDELTGGHQTKRDAWIAMPDAGPGSMPA